MGAGQSQFPNLPSYVPPEKSSHPNLSHQSEGYAPHYNNKGSVDYYYYVQRPDDVWPWGYTWNKDSMSWERYNMNLGADVPSFDNSSSLLPERDDPTAGSDPWQNGGPGTPGWNMPPYTHTEPHSVYPLDPSSSDVSYYEDVSHRPLFPSQKRVSFYRTSKILPPKFPKRKHKRKHQYRLVY